MGRSPTGSIHRIYRRPKVLKVWSSASFIGNGVDVKGDGGMFVAPPSVRADGAYEWINDEPIADAPQWLIEQIILQPSKTSTLDPYERYAREHRGPLDIEECWENLQYPGNVDDTILRVSAAMARRSVPVEEIERTIFAELRARIPESATWNWEDRVHLDNFRSKLTRLFRKEPALLEQQQNKPQWLLNWMRDNKLVEPKHPVATVEIICAADVKMRQKEWLWKGHLLRGALELLTGLPGLGKSQTQIHYMACVTAGLAWPDGASACEPMNVIMVTAEDALDIEVVPRLQAAGCNLKCIQIIKSIRIDKQKRQFLLAEDLTRLAQVIAQVGNVGLICIDPITAYMGGKMDSHKATEVRSQLGPLKDFSEGTNVVVSAITHPAKNTSARAIDQFIGSQAFIAAARIGHACFEEFEEDEETGEKTPTGRILFTNVKHNSYLKMPTLAYKIESVNIYPEPYLQIETSRVVWDKEVVNISAEQAIAAAKSNAKAVEKKEKAASEVVDFLRNIIDAGDGWCKYAEIAKQAEALGYSKSELRTAREHLEVVSKRKGGVGDDGWWEWGWEEKRPTRF
jgi:putative DNA primase/helicase